MYLHMKTIIPVSDLQREAARVLNDVATSPEPIIITQRGRPSAVLVSAQRYAEIEEDLAILDDLELEEMVLRGLREKAEGKTISLEDAKKRLNYPG